MKIMFCKYEHGYGPKDRHKDPNHMRSIKHGCLAQFSYQKVLHMAQCGGNHLLPLDPHSSQWRSFSWCMWPEVHITNVIHSTCVWQVERFYMNPIRVGVHHEANLWQTQRNLVGKGKCEWANDLRWFLKIPKYLLLGLEAQKGHLALA
jgi:hypothetical protein